MDWYYATVTEGEHVILDGDEAHHCKNVLRHKAGDTLMVTNGEGTLWEGVIDRFVRENVLVKIVNTQTIIRRAVNLHVAISPTKSSDRFEWFLEKATELGIERITPLLTHHTERSKLKYDRLQKVLVSAMKQSQQAWLPMLHEAIDFKNFIALQDHNALKLICHAHNATPIQSLIPGKQGITLLIGPEGDFAPDELTKAEEAGFIRASLGANRLRTETAGVAACAAIALSA